VNSETQGVVKGFYVFPKGRLPPGYNLQPIAIAEFAHSPEEIAFQKLPYIRDLFFSALGAEYLSYDPHLPPSWIDTAI